MVAIPEKQDLLLSAIDRMLEAESSESPPRDYLGASSVGEPCNRKIWYRLNRPPEVHSALTLRRFLDGHRTEELITSWLRRLPFIELHTHKVDGTQYGFEDGKFQGHYDGVIRGIPCAPKTWHILEIKCCNETKFKKLKDLVRQDEKTALQKWDEVYYAQAVLYMHKENIDRHYLIAATPGGRELTSVRTNQNREFALQLIDKAHRILKMTIEPARISEKKDFYMCNWCNFKDECHG